MLHPAPECALTSSPYSLLPIPLSFRDLPLPAVCCSPPLLPPLYAFASRCCFLLLAVHPAAVAPAVRLCVAMLFHPLYAFASRCCLCCAMLASNPAQTSIGRSPLTPTFNHRAWPTSAVLLVPSAAHHVVHIVHEPFIRYSMPLARQDKPQPHSASACRW
jgi:hypothetical protein